ncbi:small membrane A-kinase anchor protein isoform 1-T1 [Morphnus guianensis]
MRRGTRAVVSLLCRFGTGGRRTRRWRDEGLIPRAPSERSQEGAAPLQPARPREFLCPMDGGVPVGSRSRRAPRASAAPAAPVREAGFSLASRLARDSQGGAGWPVAGGTGRGSHPPAAVAGRGHPRGERRPWAGPAFGLASVCCGGMEEEPGFEVGSPGTGGGDASLLPPSRGQVAGSEVLETEENGGAAPAGRRPAGSPEERRCGGKRVVKLSVLYWGQLVKSSCVFDFFRSKEAQKETFCSLKITRTTGKKQQHCASNKETISRLLKHAVELNSAAAFSNVPWDASNPRMPFQVQMLSRMKGSGKVTKDALGRNHH